MKNFLNYITEIDFNIYSTKYKINYHKINNNYVESYDFASNDDNSYSVYFMITEEDNIKLSNGHSLEEYSSNLKIPTIFFSLTENEFDENFDKLTNKKEYLEVMGKVVFSILEYMNNHNFNIYSIGEVDSKKDKFYNYYRKFFKNFNIYTGKSKYYDKKCNYFIKIKNQNIDKIKLDENCYLHLNKK